jgi:uncharacterized membrane protein YuzA (DUF378 family)
MNNVNAFDWTAVALLVVGGINWGMIAAFNVDIVSYVFGEMTILTRAVYALVGLSALYIAFSALYKSSAQSTARVAYQ